MAFVLSLIGRLQLRFGVATAIDWLPFLSMTSSWIASELRKAESADNLKVSEIADAGIYSSMLLMSSMGSFEGEFLRASMAYDGYLVDALSCMPRKTRTWEATEKCPKCPRSKAVETPNDDYGRPKDGSDTRGRGRGRERPRGPLR